MPALCVELPVTCCLLVVPARLAEPEQLAEPARLAESLAAGSGLMAERVRCARDLRETRCSTEQVSKKAG